MSQIIENRFRFGDASALKGLFAAEVVLSEK